MAGASGSSSAAAMNGVKANNASGSAAAKGAAAGSINGDAGSSQDELALFSTLSAYADALDALPLDLTRSFSDLRELDAVLGTHLTSLTNRLTQLTAIVEDPDYSKGERLLALKEVAEEARAYKMGGEDKIRVALNTAETIISHTTYIDSLLSNITALPALAAFLQPAKNSHLAGHLADGTPLAPGSGPGGNNPAAASAVQAEVVAAAAAASPAKKKRPQGAGPTATTTNASATATASEKRAAQEAAASTSSGPSKKRKAPGQSSSSKARAAAAADSDLETIGSSSNAKRPAAKRAKGNGNGSSSAYIDDERTGEEVIGSTARSRAARNNRAIGRADNSDDEGASDLDGVARPARVARAPRLAHNASDNTIATASSLAAASAAGAGGGNNEDTDERRYCFCNNVSYGDMIGCDDDDCEREWFHLECVGLLKPPQGTWYCDDCAQKRAARNKSKNRKVAKTSGVHGGGVVEQKSRTSGSKR